MKSAMRPKPIANILSELMSRRGYGRELSDQQFGEVWRQVAGPQIAAMTRPGQLKRGVLEVIVANSTLLQEFTFQKGSLLTQMQQKLPDAQIKDLRFRVGSVT
jgi:predicted nucleic acid-binding Zn ribbon protein